MTTLLPPNVKVHLALGYIDMRKGIDGLAILVQGLLHQDPFTGHLFVFRGRTRANLIKIIFWDGSGFCLFKDVSEEARGRKALGNRPFRRGRLMNRPASPTAIARSTDADDPKPCRDMVEQLARRLADQVQRAAAAGQTLCSTSSRIPKCT